MHAPDTALQLRVIPNWRFARGVPPENREKLAARFHLRQENPGVWRLRLARLSITSEALVLLLIRHRAQMRVQRDPVPCPQRMFTIGEDLYVPEMGSEEFAETGAGEKIFVVALQHMSGHSFPILKIGNDLDVRHREKRPLANDPRDLFQKRLRMLDMLKHLDADCLIELLVRAGKPLRPRCGSAKWQTALLQQSQAVWIHFHPDPLMPRCDQGWTVGACSASHVKNGTAGRQIIEDKTQHLYPGFQHRRAGAVNVFSVKQSALLWENHFTEVAFLEKSWNEVHRYFSN